MLEASGFTKMAHVEGYREVYKIGRGTKKGRRIVKVGEIGHF